jgi:hypothetical protein
MKNRLDDTAPRNPLEKSGKFIEQSAPAPLPSCIQTWRTSDSGEPAKKRSKQKDTASKISLKDSCRVSEVE